MAVKSFQFVSRLCSVHRWIFLILILLGGTFTAFAQTPEPTPPAQEEDTDKPISVKTDLVTLTLTVTDLYGRYVSGLNKNAFTVFDGNQE
ncbi:MAG: hypothetical protein M3367_09085, partial [Acidobacteriota bacterium]|nr:hypothetical protein [Acidobacteriota bacterium]